MPSLVSTSVADLSQVIANLPEADRKMLIGKLDAAAVAESKDNAQRKRLSRIESAMSDDRRKLEISLVIGSLRRVA